MQQRIPIFFYAIVQLCALSAFLFVQSPGSAQSVNEITVVNPNSAAQGTSNLLVTFTLDTDFPPAPPAGVMPDSVKIGEISGASVTHSSQYTITAIFTIPISEPIGSKDAEIIFPSPQGTLTFSKINGFTVTASQGTATITPVPGTATPTPAPVTTTPTLLPLNSYPIVDTGQSMCYNNSSSMTCPESGAAFYGQDAQHNGNQPHYTLSADGLTVYDHVTGLTWQHTTDTDENGTINASDKMTWDEAQVYPNTLNATGYGGFTDWRLPTIKELYSLIDFRGMDPSGYSGTDPSGLTPFIDRDYFDFAYGDTSAGERLIDSQYASNTLYVSTASEELLFGVNFADGRIKGYGLTIFGADKTFFVQCVRGNTQYGYNNFQDNGDGTITDLATNLMWSQADSATSMNWESALAWVQTKNSLSFLGRNDWRLPNAKELQSILDYTRSPDTTNSAAINPLFTATSFTNEGGATDYPWYWTSTTHAAYNGTAASAGYVCFGRALGWMKLTGDTCYTCRDVHGAGAQRSDPKSGSTSSYYLGVACNGGSAYGHGPQGDIIRISNYVRLVRDVTAATPTPTSTYFGITPTKTPTASVSPSVPATTGLGLMLLLFVLNCCLYWFRSVNN